MYRISNIKIYEDITEKELFDYVIKKCKIKKETVSNWYIYKKSIDARDKSNIFYNYTVDVECSNIRLNKDIKKVDNGDELIKVKLIRKSKIRPVIVGAGPAGLFCALTLCEYGLNPVIIEQGKCVEERKKDVDNFLATGKLNKNSNVQFGEGGAGTFSDGKLTTGINNPYCRKVIETFYKFGAPKEILYINKPHIGTDNLINIIKNIRKEILKKGRNIFI